MPIVILFGRMLDKLLSLISKQDIHYTSMGYHNHFQDNQQVQVVKIIKPVRGIIIIHGIQLRGQPVVI